MAENAEPSVARVLAYLMIDGMPENPSNEEKSLRLSVCGFPNSEIADILGISVGSVKTNPLRGSKEARHFTEEDEKEKGLMRYE